MGGKCRAKERTWTRKYVLFARGRRHLQEAGGAEVAVGDDPAHVPHDDPDLVRVGRARAVGIDLARFGLVQAGEHAGDELERAVVAGPAGVLGEVVLERRDQDLFAQQIDLVHQQDHRRAREPLAVADDNDLWRRADKIQFTKSQSPDLVVDSGLVVSELRFDEHEYLCVLLTTRANILACLGPQKAVLVDIEQYIKIICHKCSHSIGDFVRDIQEQTKSTQTVTDSSLVSFQVIEEVNIGLRKSLLSACDKLKKFYSDEDLLDGIMAVREVILEIDKGLSVNIGHPIWKEHFLKAQDEFSFCLQSFMSKRIHFPRYLAKNLRYHYMPREELRDNCVNWNNFMTVRKSPKIGEMVNLSIIGNE